MARFRINADADSAPILDRVIEAYGFTQKGHLADHLDIASSSLAARYKRGGLPSDIMVQCMIETGVSLEWLLTGVGEKANEKPTESASVIRKNLINGILSDGGYILLDRSIFLEPKQLPQKPNMIVDAGMQYVVDMDDKAVSDGLWLVNVEEKVSIRTLTRIPVRKLRVEGAGAVFDCSIDDIEILGKVVLTIQ